MSLLERPILLNEFCFFASSLNHTMGGFGFNIKKFAGSNDASYDTQTLSNICVRKEARYIPYFLIYVIKSESQKPYQAQ